MARIRTYVPLLILVLNSCGLSSGQKEAVQGVGAATDSFGTLASVEIPAFREGIRELNAARYSVATIPLDSTIQNDDWRNFTGPVTRERVELRVRAARLLAAYGSALEQLATSDAPSSAAAQVTAIGKDLGTIPDLSLYASKFQSIGAGLGKLTGLILEERRLSALRQVVDGAGADFVTQSLKLFRTDFAFEGGGVAALYNYTQRQLDNTLITHERLVGSGTVGAQRSTFITAAAVAQRHADHIAAISGVAPKVLDEIEKAHHDLQNMLSNPSISNLDASQVIAAVQAFAATATAFRGS